MVDSLRMNQSEGGLPAEARSDSGGSPSRPMMPGRDGYSLRMNLSEGWWPGIIELSTLRFSVCMLYQLSYLAR